METREALFILSVTENSLPLLLGDCSPESPIRLTVMVLLREPSHSHWEVNSLVAYIPVDCDSKTLKRILPSAPDRAEWLQYDFISLEPPFDVLINVFKSGKHVDVNRLHPTSRYRIYLALAVLLPRRLANIATLLSS